jgi:hypothetical protein
MPAVKNDTQALRSKFLPMADIPVERDQPERSERHSVMLSATIEHFGALGISTKHRVRDLSTGGVRIDGAADFRPGATVLVTVGALESVGATVVWVKDGWAGLKFAQPVDPDQARAKAAIAPPRAGAPIHKPAVTTPSAGWITDLDSPYRK